MPITLDGTNGITTPSYGGADAAEYLVPVTAFKNRIINGAMVIDQRNAGASVTPTSGTYTLDRWVAYLSQTSKLTIQQNAGSVTPPTGFTNYLGVTSSSAYSVISTDEFNINQPIEGFNVADLGWGTANAKTVTLSFWVRSSLTGTFGGCLRNGAVSRSYPFSYTISAANTWEYKTVTVAGDTTGTWATNNTTGLFVTIGLGNGSSTSNTAGAWAAGNFTNATGATSVVGTNGATFYITGVQLEIGSTATSFDYRPYGTELNLCQRYLPAFRSASTADMLGTCFSAGGSALRANFQFLVPTRVAPSGVTSSAASTFNVNIADTAYEPTAITLTSVVSQTGALIEFTKSSPPTSGYGGFMSFKNASGYIYFTGCEL